MKDANKRQARLDAQSETLDPTKQELLTSYIIGKSVLDLGAGRGKYTNFIKPLGTWVVGLDFHMPNNLNVISTPYLRADIHHLPFTAKSVDTTICFDIFEHLETNALKEIIRVTRKRIIATVPRRTDKCLKDNWLLFGHHQDITHRRTYTKEGVIKLLQKEKLKSVLIKPVHPITTESLFLSILKGSLIKKKIARKLAFTLVRPKEFFTNIAFVADMD